MPAKRSKPRSAPASKPAEQAPANTPRITLPENSVLDPDKLARYLNPEFEVIKDQFLLHARFNRDDITLPLRLLMDLAKMLSFQHSHGAEFLFIRYAFLRSVPGALTLALNDLETEPTLRNSANFERVAREYSSFNGSEVTQAYYAYTRLNAAVAQQGGLVNLLSRYSRLIKPPHAAIREGLRQYTQDPRVAQALIHVLIEYYKQIEIEASYDWDRIWYPDNVKQMIERHGWQAHHLENLRQNAGLLPVEFELVLEAFAQRPRYSEHQNRKKLSKVISDPPFGATAVSVMLSKALEGVILE